jgi:hypothetical protein
MESPPEATQAAEAGGNHRSVPEEVPQLNAEGDGLGDSS